jgi:hypothetical protein
MKPFFTYFGGKYRSAPKYGSPIYDKIVEPFAGSAGYSCRFGANKEVILCDLNDKVFATWDWLINARRKDVLGLPLYFSHIDEVDAPIGAKNLIGFWLNKGSTSPAKTPSRWMRDNIRPKSFWGVEIRDRVAAQVDLIRGWRCQRTSFSALEGEGEATWFIDPPYKSLPRMYPNRFDQYDRLRDFCLSRRGQVIVCEGPNAAWLPFQHLTNIKGLEGRNGGKVSSEWVWTNG